MNTNEECLIKYISFAEFEQGKTTNALINFLIKKGMKFSFEDLNPVCNIIDELEFFDNIKYD